jgi:hypothetical protein
MIAVKLEQRDEHIVAVFDEATLSALALKVGDTVYLQRADFGVVALAEHDPDHEARTARGRALLKRYQRTFEAYSGT